MTFEEAEKILKKEFEEHANAPVSGKERSEKGNPALKESASQFNDALLDEQGKKINHLVKEINHLVKEITRLNMIIHNKNEELLLTEIREKNLAELGLKYVVENEKLKKNLADKIVALCNELSATRKELEEKTKLVEEVRKYSKEYREYGIEAVKLIRKMAKAIVFENPICSEDFKEYRRLANGYSFNPQLPDLSEEEDKKLSPVKDANSNGDVTNQKDISPSLKVTVRLFGDDVIDLFKNMQHLW